MRKRTNVTAVLVAVLVALAAGAAGLAGGTANPRAQTAEPVFDPDVGFRSEYGVGYNLVVPQIPVTADGETLPVSAVLTVGGKTVATLGADDSQIKVRLNTLGDYVLTYVCTYEGATYTRTFSFTVKDMPYFESELGSVYPIGSELPLDAVAVYKGERKTARAFVNGTEMTSYRAASLGELGVEFRAVFDKEYTQTTVVTIKLDGYDDLFGGNTGVTSIDADVDAPTYMRAGNGVRVMAAASGSVVRFANVIDLNSLSSTDDLIRFTPLSGEGYSPLKQLYVRLVDAHDPSNSVRWRFYSVTWDDGTATAYAGFNYDGREMGRFNEAGSRFGEVRSDWMVQLPNATCDIDRSPADKKTDRMWMATQVDYENRQFFVTSELPAGQDPWLILDADDATQVGVGKEWRGFTTGEAWLEIAFDGSGKTGVLITEVAGQSLSGAEIADTTAPGILTDYADDSDMPLGYTGQPYPIPKAAKVLDAVEGELDPADVGIRLLQVKGILSEDISDKIVDGVFLPTEAGQYRIEYSASDSAGNTARKYVAFEISAEKPEIVVTCDLPQQAYVGQTLNLPDVTVTGMTTLVKRVVSYSYNGIPTGLTPGNDLFLAEEGTLTLDYELVDYVGSTRSARLTTAVTTSPDPIITVKGMPYTAIAGRDLLLPAFTAYDYNFDASDPRYEPLATISVNGKAVDTETRKYAVTEKAGTQLQIVYAAGNAKAEYEVDVVDPKLLSDYFLPSSSGTVTPVNSADHTGFRFENDLTLRPINPVAINNVSGFPIAFEAAGSGTIEVWLTDFERPTKSIFFRVDTARHTLTICGQGTEYPIPDGKLTLRYKSIGQLLADYGVVRTWTDGTPFDGFGGVATVEWRLEGFGQSELKLYTLGMVDLRSTMQNGAPQPFRDEGVPQIVTESSVYDESPTVGEMLTVPAAQAWTALSGMCEVQMTLYNAEGDTVFERVPANRAYYTMVDGYGVWLIEYRVSYGDGAIDEKSMPVTVRSVLPPTVSVKGTFAETYAVGTELTIPQIDVNGVGECEVYVSVTAPDGSVTNYAPGDKLTIGLGGAWRLTVIASDDWNYTVRQFCWTAA